MVFAHSDFTRDLSGSWSLETAEGDYQTSIQIPGDVHSALHSAGLISEPYFGRNEYDLRWVADREWVFTRTVSLSEDDLGSFWYLDIDYLDTVATVYINDIKVLDANSCFLRYRPDVSKALKSGDNQIKVIIHSAVSTAAELQAKQPFYIPYIANNCPIPNGNMLRKPQCDFGWDWNIALAPLGMYGTVALKKLATARIEHVVTQQVFDETGGVDLHATITFFANEPGILPVHLSLDDERVRLDCAVNSGETTITHVFRVDQPKLWWPSGAGEQAISKLSIEIPSETVTRQIGFRTAELLTDADEAGNRFALRINGREIFCRGANWIPADALFSRSNREKTKDLLQSAVDANMNMIRIWGGGFYEQSWFYDLCDELGLMVWHDFMFACNIYPSTPDFLALVREEVIYQTKRLSSHASIVLWCGDNELVGALTWFEETRKDRDRYLVSYDRLNRTIEVAMKETIPDAIWWPSSPSVGYLNFGDAWHADGSGDMHFWSVWHENKSFDHYRSVKPRFCSEFGFQSYTSLPIVKDFAELKDMNIASPVMESHQKNVGGNERIAGTMFRYFRFPKDFDNFVYLSQIQQGLAIRTAIEYWRSLKPHCMGTIIWQLNDTWPVASWASLDYGGGWKALHYMARRFFQPVTVFAVPSPDEKMITLSMVNDTADSVDVHLQTFLVTLDGERVPFKDFSGACSPDKAGMLGTIEASDIPEGSLLFWSFAASNMMIGEGHYTPVTYKTHDLQPSNINMQSVTNSDGTYSITVTAQGLALFVTVEADIKGRYSDNVFDLTSGESRTVTFRPDDAGAAPTFRWYDLHSCQTQL